MKKIFIILLMISFAVGCKKKPSDSNNTCPCVVGLSDSIQGGNIDSATFYNQLLGTWDLKQADTIVSDIGRPHHCYCDAPYPVTFLANNTFIMHFADNIIDTFPYNFPVVAPQKIGNQCYFYVYGNNPRQGQIQYVNSKFMIIQIASSTEDFDACPVFFLTKH